MKKFGVKVYYEGYVYVTVDAENREDAFDKALDKIDDMDNSEFANSIISTNSIVDKEVDEI